MKEYAANDVIYLPKLYNLMKKNIKDLPEAEGTITYQGILDECQKTLKYPKLNLNIKNFNKYNIPKGKEIDGMLKYEYFIIISLGIL